MTANTVKIRLSSDGSTDVHVRFEPAGPEHTLTGEDWLDVEITATDDDPTEICQGPGYFIVWPSPRTTLAAWTRDGEPLPFLV